MKPAPTLHPDLAAVIQEVLARAAAPLNLAKLRSQLTGPYKVPAKLKDALIELLKAEVLAGRIHEWSGDRFWNRDSKAWAEPTMLEAARVPVAPKKLIAAVAKPLGKPAAEALLDELINDGRLIRIPLFGGGSKTKLCSRIEDEAAFRAQLDAAQRIIEAGYRRLSGSPDHQILDAIAALEPQKGLLVTAPKIYRALPHIPKRELDAALLNLQETRRVILHRHSNPHGLSASERETLIEDQAGNFYVGACWRLAE